jgi:hypothetical protein
MDKAGWGARIEACILHVQARRRERLTLDEFGAMVAADIGRPKPFRKTAVSQWVAETNEPSIRIFEAIARLANCDPWWIVWNVGRAPANVLEDELTRETARETAAAVAREATRRR